MNRAFETPSTLVISVMGLLACGPALAGSYVYTTIDVPGSTDTLITAINDKGTATGYTIDGTGRSRGFIWSARSVSTFEFGAVPGDTFPIAINEKGTVAGTFRPDRKSFLRNFVRAANGATHALPLPGGTTPYARGLNRTGHVVGDVYVGGVHQGYVVAGRTATYLLPPGASGAGAGAINDGGTIAGEFTDISGQHGYVYRDGVFTGFFNPPHPASIEVLGINKEGLVFGTTLNARQNDGFTYDGSRIRHTHPPFAWNSWVVQAFNPGHLLGVWDDSEGGHGAGFVLQDHTYTIIAPPGAAFTNVAGGTPSGMIAGYYEDSSRLYHGFIAVCPAGQEPCTR